jgi:hypothetical protein
MKPLFGGVDAVWANAAGRRPHDIENAVMKEVIFFMERVEEVERKKARRH